MSELFLHRTNFVFIYFKYVIVTLMKVLLEGIKNQHDPEILQRALAFITYEHDLLKKSYQKVLNEIEKQKQTSFQFADVLTIMRKLIFGKGREKIKGDDEVSSRKRLAEERYLLVHSKSLVPPPRDE